MLKKLSVPSAILLFTITNTILAGSKHYGLTKTPVWLTYSRLSELTSTYDHAYSYNIGTATMQQKSEETQPFHYPLVKSPKRALFFSALIPGMGEFYCKSYIKSIAFFGLEAALWVSYLNFTDEGNRLEDEFEAFANAHWSRDRYETWKSTTEGENAEKTHELPETNTQQYYEMIGKYDQFYFGWDDVDKLGLKYGDRKGIRMDYMTMRKDSNDKFKTASTMVSLVLLNHLISAVDAAWSAFRYNKHHYETQQLKNKKKTSLRFEPIHISDKVYPALALRLRW